MPDNNEREPVRCSFCGKSEQSVERMLHSSRANICDNCVALCYDMLVEEGIDVYKRQEWTKLAADLWQEMCMQRQ